LIVDIPKGAYKGQKLMKLVKIKMAAKTKSTMAVVPEMLPIKYKIAITTAASILTALSIVPIFFFI
jgi:hypothetical protein